ncbi:LysR family transcriptional regulator [Roseomonas sp. CCTCC AB2023176]|uniref:LysR family transcriptional regulator n=1 Tax=Roseomonas sp. CCTCC AB2023176 TaxID=3342640 RepID=UPI0035D57F13
MTRTTAPSRPWRPWRGTVLPPRAAAALEVTPSAISHAIRGLEERVGGRLVNRTTRSVALTEAGARLLARAGPALEAIGAALAEAGGDGAVRGTVRLNVPQIGAALVVAPAIARLAEVHPGLHLDVAVEDGTTDIVARGFDAGIRLGERLEADMIAVPVSGPMRMAAAASPDYLARRGVPEHPRDLAGHACLRYRYAASSAVYRWEFERDGAALEVSVEGPLTTSHPELMVNAALQGGGIAFTVEAYMAPHLESGRLVRVLEPWCPPFPGLFLYYPSARGMSAPLRAVVETLRRR